MPSVTALAGFPSRREVVARYAAQSNRDLSGLNWYAAFGFFKLAVVAAGVAARARAGAMGTGPGADDSIAAAIAPLAASGLRTLAAPEID